MRALVVHAKARDVGELALAGHVRFLVTDLGGIGDSLHAIHCLYVEQRDEGSAAPDWTWFEPVEILYTSAIAMLGQLEVLLERLRVGAPRPPTAPE